MRVVDNARRWWTWASAHFALLLSLLAAKGLTTLGIVASVLSLAPPELRAFVPLPIAGALFGLWLILRLWQQKPPDA
jgi:hypothetical protein